MVAVLQMRARSGPLPWGRRARLGTRGTQSRRDRACLHSQPLGIGDMHWSVPAPPRALRSGYVPAARHRRPQHHGWRTNHPRHPDHSIGGVGATRGRFDRRRGAPRLPLARPRGCPGRIGVRRGLSPARAPFRCSMRLLIDENLSPRVAELLRVSGIDAPSMSSNWVWAGLLTWPSAPLRATKAEVSSPLTAISRRFSRWVVPLPLL